MFDIIGEKKELYQWDTDRKISVPDGITKVRFSHLTHGVSKDIDVVGNEAQIPPEFLRIHGSLHVWGSDENNTYYDATFEVRKSPKPDDYVFTPEDVKKWEDLQKQIGNLEELPTENKESLVGAINEVFGSGGGSGVVIVQEPGDREDVVMSQKATTEQIEPLKNSIFEIEKVESSNKFDPYNITTEQYSGTDYYVSQIILCKIGDNIRTYATPENGSFGKVTFGIRLFSEEGKTDLVSLGAGGYNPYVVSATETVPIPYGLQVLVASSRNKVNYSQYDVMVTVNEEATEFVPYGFVEEEVNRIERLEKDVDDLEEAVSNIGGGSQEPPSIVSRWHGKNVLVFGDSISTYDYANYNKWTYFLQKEKEFNLYNYSHHACGYIRAIDIWPRGDMPRQIEKAAIDFGTETDSPSVVPDLIILFMGTNDFYVQIPVGQEGDGMVVNMNYTGSYITPTHTIDYSNTEIDYTKNTLGTFYAGVEHSMARIKELWASATVCVLTPMQRLGQTSANDGMSLEDYRNVIVKTARRFSYPVKDLFTDANFAPSNPYDRYAKTLYVQASSAYDGLHPSEEFGEKHLAPAIGAFIEDMTSGVGYIETAEQGEKGEKGDKGDKGDPGEKGDPGDDYVLSDEDKTEIAEQAAALIDDLLLPIIGSGIIE